MRSNDPFESFYDVSFGDFNDFGDKPRRRMRLRPMRRPNFRYKVRALTEDLVEKTGIKPLKRLLVLGSDVPEIEISNSQLAAICIQGVPNQ